MQQLEDRLGRGVGLSHGRDRGLFEHLGFGEIGRFLCHIGIAELRFRRGEVGDLRVGQIDGVLELVLSGADAGLRVAQLRECGVDGGDGRQRVAVGAGAGAGSGYGLSSWRGAEDAVRGIG